MKQIYVALEHAGKTVPVGVLRFDSKQGFGYFTYMPTYSGPPLDPVNLNYRAPLDPGDRLRRGERVFVVDAAANPGLMHQVFVDAMPGGWGMAVLQAEYPEIRQMKDAERLHWMGARTAGALSFFVKTREDEKPVVGLNQLEIMRAKCAEFQAKLEKMGLLGVRNPAVASHGGVMPKASYEDAQGRHWIAKFDQPGVGAQVCLMEHLTVSMARRCGITAPETKTLADGIGGHMFLTERYDRGAQERFHKASFMSLTGAKDAGAGDYRDMFATLQKVCDPVAWPQQRDELLRRMAFNVGLNVTDDHLRNHEVRLASSGSWELSPAFDLVPVSGPSPHQCAIFGQARANIDLSKPATRELWTRIATELGASPEHVLGLVGGVATKLQAEWPAMVAASGMNRFNQMQALMAAEVGCAVPFPDQARSPQVVPLDAKASAELSDATKLMQRAMSILKGAPMAKGEDMAVSKGLVRLSAESTRLSHLMRGAGHKEASEQLLTAPLKSAARAVLEPGATDPAAWRDLEEVASSIGGAIAQPAARSAARAGPR